MIIGNFEYNKAQNTRYYAATATKRRRPARPGFSDPYSTPRPIQTKGGGRVGSSAQCARSNLPFY